jgi:hypothetical protein
MIKRLTHPRRVQLCAVSASIVAAIGAAPAHAQLTPGNLVISTVSNSTGLPNASALDTAAPIVLQQFSLGAGGTTATAAGTMTLTQTSNGANSAISGEYGSASEGLLQQSANGQYLTMMGYGVNANAFNSAPLTTYGTAALGQTTSLTAAAQTGTPVTTVARVVALISGSGAVDTSTALTGVFNNNNARSVATVDGSSFYVSGQGASQGDATEGVFYAARGSTTATVIDNSTDTRAVSIVNNTLYVSRDVNPPNGGTQNSTNVSSLTNSSGGLPTSAAGLITTHITPPASPLSSGGNNGSINLTAALANGVNNAREGSFVYLSPEQYFFASPDVLYVADSGAPKNGNANKAALGEGGLQKWVLTAGTWTLDYDLVAGLNLVNNANANSSTPTAAGVTGLLGLTGKVVGSGSSAQVELFATSYGLNELSPSFLYEITDTQADTSIGQAGSESFTTLDTAADGTSIRGVAFAPVAPVPLPAAAWLLMSGLGALGALGRRRTGVPS